jgi:hypothetical protein
MKKFQATIHFEMDEQFSGFIPAHRSYINRLIEKGIIDQYVVSMESQRVWITFTADTKSEVEEYLSNSPIYSYLTIEIDELFLIDGLHYRLPTLQMN